MIISLSIVYNGRRWISLDYVSSVLDTKRIQGLPCLLNDFFPLLYQCVDDRIFDDSDTVPCCIGHE